MSSTPRRKGMKVRKPNPMKTYKFKMYSNHGNRDLHKTIESFAAVYNHCIALHRRYYALFSKGIHKYRLNTHITKLKRTKRFAHWNNLPSQAVQDVVERIDKGYKLFFRNLKHGIKTARPKFKAWRKYKSFTLKQAGWKWFGNGFVRIRKRIYRYFNSRAIEGIPKTLTIKRDTLGDLYFLSRASRLSNKRIENCQTSNEVAATCTMRG